MRRRRHTLYQNSRGVLAHPDSPAGGTGTGFSRPPGSVGLGHDHSDWNSLAHPDSPAGKHITHTDIVHFATLNRAECVSEAVERAQALAGSYILQESGQALNDLISGIVPTLLLGVGILGLTTGAGAAGGAALGSLAMGVGAVPGTVLGASAGFETGLAHLDALGLGFFWLTFRTSCHRSTRSLDVACGGPGKRPIPRTSSRMSRSTLPLAISHGLSHFCSL